MDAPRPGRGLPLRLPAFARPRSSGPAGAGPLSWPPLLPGSNPLRSDGELGAALLWTQVGR
eukprot:8990529-Alexandrium_andersonii.AAC.1